MNPTTYIHKSKRDVWLTCVILLTSILLIYQIFHIDSVIGNAVLILTVFFLNWLFFATKYVITENRILASSGPFKTNIDIDKIVSLEPSRDPTSSFATSLDRLKLSYSRYNYYLLSPLDKELFIKQLLDVNPKIKYNG